MATITDVSRLAKVSKATVSRVLTGSRGVREESREAVLKAVESLNYRPNIFAQSLAREYSNQVAVLIRDADAGQLSAYLPQFTRAIQAMELELVIGFASQSEQLAEQLERFSQLNPVATIVFGPCPEQMLGPRTIVIGAGEQSIRYDYTFACESALRYLLSQGHRQVAIWLDDDEEQVSEELLAGYRQALQNQSLPFNRELVIHGQHGSEQSLLELLNRYLPFTALLVRRDGDAAVAIRLLREFNIAVPGEVSLMSLEDSPLAVQLSPPLTCIHYPIAELFDAALDKLAQVLHKQAHHDNALLRGRLVIRQSVSKAN
ncbi:LacI family DNA-binding transcriptional regulator [Celerinatantimonas diazotrophica]|uniref:LacI family transcriptional regulator n=1 Tax=Celerinatantimonas diazotrophica TaxID=412034 RepID=A0A4R1K4G5_9GAMM|nr:LacI family DNA-binding transcriptional regulator [Celerinatantimonas diazotrophica]TCK59018.1 LacI family transcriptional regulator [Celerinatantimonas diazotrophica]CAG9297653.1 HTH-type transcriptional regulator GalR [Celerinatantimonas diazotrophica]